MRIVLELISFKVFAIVSVIITLTTIYQIAIKINQSLRISDYQCLLLKSPSSFPYINQFNNGFNCNRKKTIIYIQH